MKRKSLLFAAIFFLSIAVQAAVGDQFVNGEFQYVVLTESEEDNTVSISKIEYDYSLSGDVTIPATVENDGTTYTVTALANNAFLECRHISSINLPATVNTIGADVFSFCFDLSAINVSAENPYFTSVDGVVYNKELTKIVACPKTLSGLFEIPEAVTEIASHCFHSCNKLTAITIPENVNLIGDFAFFGCSSLKNIEIPSSASIASSYTLFAFCSSLESIEVGAENKTVCSLDGVMYSKNMVKLMAYPVAKEGDVVIPESVSQYASYCFANCNSLTTFDIPSRITLLGSGTFAGCSNLTEITVDESNDKYTSVDGVVFNKGKTTLVQFPAGRTGEYVIPDGIVTLGNSSFREVEISSVVIPESVKKIDGNAFRQCKNLTALKFLCVTPPSMTYASLLETQDDLVVKVPMGSKSAYQEAWPFVTNFEEFDDSGAGIEEISEDSSNRIDYDQSFDIYDLSGKKMTADLKKLTPGVYIVRQGELSKKVEVR